MGAMGLQIIDDRREHRSGNYRTSSRRARSSRLLSPMIDLDSIRCVDHKIWEKDGRHRFIGTPLRPGQARCGVG